MKTADIRKSFLNFFASKQHSVVESDSLVPKEDPTVLFTTAGMQQFKKNFLGQDKTLNRAATSQKCLRTDDLSQVGLTAFHHTFFEMLGNFSFGDYFKKEAISWAWEFLTVIVGLPKEKLWVSVYLDDPEAEDIWINKIKIDPKKLVRLGDKNNFWPSQAKEKGPNGPCGPCSEIFYDYGTNPKCQKHPCDPECDCGRFSEIWNLVFTQYDRKDFGILEPLPAKNIDTGMGLERLAAIVQGKKTNFEIDIFEPIFESIAHHAQKFNVNLSQYEKNIIADHVRAIVFSISDGVIPSNEGRGYIVKKLIADSADILLEKTSNSFIHKLVPSVIAAMKDPYQDLCEKEKNIITWVQKTENAYAKVRSERIPELKKEICATQGSLGDIIFKYRDTYGLTLSAAKHVMIQAGLSQEKIDQSLDEAQQLMDVQRQKSRESSKMTGNVFVNDSLSFEIQKTKFIGEDLLEAPAKIIKIFSQDNKEILLAQKNQKVKIILDQTPFYAESGGQQGDDGLILSHDNIFKVLRTYKNNDIFIHEGEVQSGSLVCEQDVIARVNSKKRYAIMRNHTATHLLQSSLRKVLGSHVQQQGSLVADDHLRFDFTHPKALTPHQLIEIENNVNQTIRACIPVQKKETSFTQAKKEGALAFFAEKYTQNVRIISIGDTSKELCGGTHLRNSGEVGLFKILNESAIAQGIRRIEAITGDAALKNIQQTEETLNCIAQILKTPTHSILDRLKDQQKKIKNLEKILSDQRLSQLTSNLTDLLEKSISIHNIKIITHAINDIDIQTLKRYCDIIKQKAQTAVIALASLCDEGSFLVVAVTKDLVEKEIRANKIIDSIAPLINAKGGGSPYLAQAGSKTKQNFDKAFSAIIPLIKEKLLS